MATTGLHNKPWGKRLSGGRGKGMIEILSHETYQITPAGLGALRAGLADDL